VIVTESLVVVALRLVTTETPLPKGQEKATLGTHIYSWRRTQGAHYTYEINVATEEIRILVY